MLRLNRVLCFQNILESVLTQWTRVRVNFPRAHAFSLNRRCEVNLRWSFLTGGFKNKTKQKNMVVCVGVSLPLMLPWIYCRQRGSQASISCASWTTAHTPTEQTHRRTLREKPPGWRNVWKEMQRRRISTFGVTNMFKNNSQNTFKWRSKSDEDKMLIKSSEYS